jgi:hypothetical protein
LYQIAESEEVLRLDARRHAGPRETVIVAGANARPHRNTSEDAMANRDRESNQSVPPSSEYVKGGKGRKDDVRGSRIYPASSPDAPVNADVRTVRDFVKHRSPESKHPKGLKRAI